MNNENTVQIYYQEGQLLSARCWLGQALEAEAGLRGKWCASHGFCRLHWSYVLQRRRRVLVRTPAAAAVSSQRPAPFSEVPLVGAWL